jgi:hypothetical protein
MEREKLAKLAARALEPWTSEDGGPDDHEIATLTDLLVRVDFESRVSALTDVCALVLGGAIKLSPDQALSVLQAVHALSVRSKLQP